MDREKDRKQKSDRERAVRGCDGCGRILSDCSCGYSDPYPTPWHRGDDEDLSYD